jgi:hypothetical protein
MTTHVKTKFYLGLSAVVTNFLELNMLLNIKSMISISYSFYEDLLWYFDVSGSNSFMHDL